MSATLLVVEPHSSGSDTDFPTARANWLKKRPCLGQYEKSKKLHPGHQVTAKLLGARRPIGAQEIKRLKDLT